MKNQKKGKSNIKRILRDKKFWARVMCGILVFLMLLSAVMMTLQFFTIGLYAAENQTQYYYNDDGDVLIAVGLMYAGSVTVGFETKAENGFHAGMVKASDRSFTSLAVIPNNSTVSVICDANLAKNGMTYSFVTSQAPAVGGYHLEVPVNSGDIDGMLESCRSLLSSLNLNIFPAYINGSYTVRIGQYASYEDAQYAMMNISAYGIDAVPCAPSSTALSVIDPYTDEILFEYDGGTESTLGLAPIQNEGKETAYLVTPAGNTYGGVFKYTRYISSGANGVAVTNILTLEEYVEGVLPYEVSNQSSQNLLRTFAVSARSFAMSQRKHATFDMCNSTCCQMYKGRNKTNAAIIEAVEATKGFVLTYDGTVANTTYSSSTGGVTVSASSAWGKTDKYPYLSAVVTPWEDYQNVPYGSWTVEMTPSSVMSRLKSNGYTSLTGDIASITIDELAEGSTYVYALRVTDTYGNSVVIKKTDTVRSVFGLNSANFVVGRAGEKVTVTEYTYGGSTAEAIAAIKASRESDSVTVSGSSSQTSAETKSADDENKTENTGDNSSEQYITDENILKLPSVGSKTVSESEVQDAVLTGSVYVLTAASENPIPLTVAESVVLTNGSDGIELNQNPSSVVILSEEGLSFVDMTETLFIPVDQIIPDVPPFSDDDTDSGEVSGNTDGDSSDNSSSDNTDSDGDNNESIFGGSEDPEPSLPDLDPSAAEIVVKTYEVTAEGKEGNFVFIGRGWGHGVGISQYGASHLAALGYDYETILSLYFPGTQLLHWNNILK